MIFLKRAKRRTPVRAAKEPETQRIGPLLAVENLSVEFHPRERTVRAVSGISFAMAAGETLAIVGESGCGKTVSALAILGLLPKNAARITSGSIRFDGRELIGLSESEMERVRGHRISMVFQDPLTSLNPILTVGRQITETLEAHLAMGRKAARVRAAELLRIVGIPEAARRLDEYPHQFSGGMRQRVMIAMALSCDPAILIADEPTTALDVTIQAQVLEVLQRLRREFAMSVLLITHDLGVVAGIADRVAVMYAGRIVEIGPTEAVLADAMHPYTVGLLRSVPRIDRDRTAALVPIEGAPPDLRTRIEGCPFAPRCAWRIDVCGVDDPGLVPAAGTDGPVDGSRLVACHNRPTSAEAKVGHPLGRGTGAADVERGERERGRRKRGQA